MMLLKSIHFTTSAMEVEEELKIEGLPIIKVSPYRSRKTSNKEFNSFVVELSKTCDIAEVYTKTSIMNHKVYWEHFKANDIVQCRNRQRFGHVAVNCGMNYVCVKCKDSHLPGECPRKDNSTHDVWCANCKTEGHPANYRGCPTLKKKQEEKKQALTQKKAQQEFVTKSACTFTKPAISFAAISRKNPVPKSTINPFMKPTSQIQPAVRTPKKTSVATPSPSNGAKNSGQNLTKEVKRLFGSDLITVMDKARSAVPPNYNYLSEKQKSMALATFIFDLCSA